MTTTYQIPEYLLSGTGCEQLPTYESGLRMCHGGHPEAVRQDPVSGRYFITMGHPGFNSPANNRGGYASRAKAEAAMRHYARPRR
jgi:hypothetical protein